MNTTAQQANANLAAYHERRAAHYAALGQTDKADAQTRLVAIYRRRSQEG